jgi:hypothetical protein
MTQRMTRFLVTLLIASLIVVGGGTDRAGAQQQTAGPPTPSQSALGVSPAIIEEVLTPGKPTAFTLTVSNVTNFPLPVKGMVRDFTVQSADLQTADRDRLDASKWFTLDEPDFIIQPHQVRTIKASIQPPADASPGGHYATIFFQPLVPEEALSVSTAYMNARVGVLAFTVVKGDITQKLSIATPLHAPGVIQRGNATFSFALKNNGNVHLLPSGTLTIYNGRNKAVAALHLPPGIILPNETKTYDIPWQPPEPVGKYRGQLSLRYGDDNTRLPQQDATFVIIPWMGMSAALVIFVGGVLFIHKTRRRWHKAWRALRG